jgi:hypothetical protein
VELEAALDALLVDPEQTVLVFAKDRERRVRVRKKLYELIQVSDRASRTGMPHLQKVSSPVAA